MHSFMSNVTDGLSKGVEESKNVKEYPLRAELFSGKQLSRHAAALARQHQIDKTPGTNRLLLRLAKNEKALLYAYDLVVGEDAGKQRISPAGEWLLNNFYLIEGQIRLTRFHLPKEYNRELPRLLNGINAGLPRVYDIAMELITHTDGRIDAENVNLFVDNYQSVTTLTIGELWAIPIMLRLGLIENLRRVSMNIVERRHDFNLATMWVKRLSTASKRNNAAVLRVLAEMADTELPFSSIFVEEFFSRSERQDPALATVDSWIQHRLAEKGLTRESLQRADRQGQAEDQVSIANSIGSLRFLNTMKWQPFVEEMSRIEQILQNDPSNIYHDMDFFTRDWYRHVVEKLARRANISEEEVAQTAIELATDASRRDGRHARNAHVGFYLVGKERKQLESAIKVRWSLRHWLKRTLRKFPLSCYIGAIFLITALTVCLTMTIVEPMGRFNWAIVLMIVLSFIGASQMAIALVNFLINILVSTHRLPRLDFSKGIPDEHRTMVVIPTLLNNPQGVKNLLASLEIRYLGNRDPNLSFALLTDFLDAPEEVQPDDAELVQLVSAGIENLNKQYSSNDNSLFYLFHRKRVWNPYERLWMGYERKRGKLEQFNELLRGGSHEMFSKIIGDLKPLPLIQYVITLDTDTTLPHGTAAKLVGTIAHPLNRPRLDPVTGRVVEGYAILQPRASTCLSSANSSLFTRLCVKEAGIDPYTNEVSDVYQDLFREGSYVGKGIYDVDAFRQSTNERFPENLILSHDLIESGYARSGLVTDVELYEEHPTSLPAEMSRRHRWTRGDWQIAKWLLPRVPGMSKKFLRNPLSWLTRWKIFDNLRRSLVTPSLLMILLGGWTIMPTPIGFWTLFVVFLTTLPIFLTTFGELLLHKPRERTWRIHGKIVLESGILKFSEAILTLATLPYHAVVNLDAIIVSAGRMIFTRRGLMLWNTEHYALRNKRTTLGDFFLEMWVTPLFAITATVALALTAPNELFFSGPLLVLWLTAPVICWWTGRPIVEAKPKLSDSQYDFLHKLTRQTWRFFETQVNAEGNWLPPDNIQEDRIPEVAFRTSPTNIGMSLLANLAAADFGYITNQELLERTANTLKTMERLEHFRGHLYNWYDTKTCQPMLPYYVSSVDSGNLFGALITLRVGLLELKNQPIISPRLAAGLLDTLKMISSPQFDSIRTKLNNFADRSKNIGTQSQPFGLSDIVETLEELIDDITAIADFENDEEQWWKSALEHQCRAALNEISFLIPDLNKFDHIPSLQDLSVDEQAGKNAAERIEKIEKLVARCSQQEEMDFSFLYSTELDLISIGFNVSERRRDSSHYDLLASEARLISFILVAQDKLPQEHWFALGRQLTIHDNTMALLSWSGSMFEYLMPLLLMPTYENTLLNQTYCGVVKRQIEYGCQRNVPWGISESGYNTVDTHGSYQYRAFGVPGLGLKRGLAEDLVIAPYASALALMVMPEESCKNLQKLSKLGHSGKYGLYEAIDFTPSRLPLGKHNFMLPSYMAHHQGMSLLALTYLLLDRPMQRRFMSDPRHKTAELLLQERMPKAASPIQPHAKEVDSARLPLEALPAAMRVFPSPHTPTPQVHLLSNGNYHLMVTNAGGGYSRWRDLAITRWREDATRDCWGMFCYLRDTESGALWSTAYQPTQSEAKHQEAIFVRERAEYRRQDNDIESYTEIVVSPEDDVEVRRITLTNLSPRTRVIELTSYAEVVLAPLKADIAHPVFSNLFVHTEIINGSQAILCTRRPRAATEEQPWMFHLLISQGELAEITSYETDRAKFIGRCRTTSKPAAFDNTGPLSNTDGAVLDPIVAIRNSLTIQADTSANWYVVTGVAETRADALMMVDKYRDSGFAERAFDMASSHTQLLLNQLQANEADTQVYLQLAASMIYSNPQHRATANILNSNKLAQPDLWKLGISGDLPILLLRIADLNRLELVRDVLKAHAFWQEKGLKTDLVIVNEDFSGYRQSLHEEILDLIASSTEKESKEIFLWRGEQLSEEDRILLQAVARVILTDSAKPLEEQVEEAIPTRKKLPLFVPTRAAIQKTQSDLTQSKRVFFNGLGGFTPDGREYVISLKPGQTTPAPWSNVLANEKIGTIVTESGGSYTWVDNAQAFRITPWNNDPVSDASGEAFYICDEETGQFWSPMPMPARGESTYICRHGFGYSVFEYSQFDISSEAWVYVALDSPVKLVTIKIRNRSGRNRRLSMTGYWELILGESHHANQMHVVTSIDPDTSALFARSSYNREFAGKTVFVNVSGGASSFTDNRTDFIGRNGTLANPRAMYETHLAGRSGPGFDPCAALQTKFDLSDGEDHELVFIIGAADSADEAHRLVRRYADPHSAQQELENVWEFWKKTLGVVYVETPDPAFNIMANGWLVYQALSCRYWGRSGYYQSGGAYGFRDQLQDTTAIIHAAPVEAREHLLRSASRQFVEGDVQHWWHPPSGRGVRTRCSDDYLWLPYATCRYVKMTGDTGVLQEIAGFLEGRPVNEGEESYYDLPQNSTETATLYQHCVRAIKYGLKFGEHGLPLIGTCDWNDGMNLVGIEGKGESIWLAFFLYKVLNDFAELAQRQDDAEFSAYCLEMAKMLQVNIEKNGWDGEWYRRAYFDNGEPLGSSTNEECQIDSIVQSWAVISGAADPSRARQGMENVNRRLVQRDDKLIRLFHPPFAKSSVDPGYIKGYPPGVRENGGQYTHAAIWTAIAFAEMGETELAWEMATLLNPIRHATNPADTELYMVEPYVVAADIYSSEPHIGRGGWTWYTGASGWMYRLLIETLLGLQLEVDTLRINPKVPKVWSSFKLHYRYQETFYHITVRRSEDSPKRPIRVVLNGQEQPEGTIKLINDRQNHKVQVIIS